MLHILDILLTVAHFAVIFFNLFGWIPEVTRKAHFISIVLTAASWFILGIWFGTGYCPLTDWQWNIKAKLGERNLPGNFVEYVGEKIFRTDLSSDFINYIIAIPFVVAATISVFLNFIFKKRQDK